MAETKEKVVVLETQVEEDAVQQRMTIQAVRSFLQAREWFHLAEEMHKSAQQTAIAAMKANGIDTIRLADGTQVTCCDGFRREFDAETLGKLLPHAVYKEIVVERVSAELFDKMVKEGFISHEVITSIGGTKYDQLRVTAPKVQ